MNVSREQDEEGNGFYRISSRLVHMAIIAIIGALLSLGGYMVAWALNDSYWKSAKNERDAAQEARLAVIEAQLMQGILPIARERVIQLERRIESLEKKK